MPLPHKCCEHHNWSVRANDFQSLIQQANNSRKLGEFRVSVAALESLACSHESPICSHVMTQAPNVTLSFFAGTSVQWRFATTVQQSKPGRPRTRSGGARSGGFCVAPQRKFRFWPTCHCKICMQLASSDQICMRSIWLFHADTNNLSARARLTSKEAEQRD